jgi:hypothetical protein
VEVEEQDMLLIYLSLEDSEAQEEEVTEEELVLMTMVHLVQLTPVVVVVELVDKTQGLLFLELEEAG